MKTKFNIILMLFLAFMQITFAQERTISGVVSDDLGPVADVTIKVQGTESGAITDFDGNYSIKAKTGDILLFTHISYGKQSKTVGASNSINVTMSSIGNTLDEVVVVAYGVEKRETITSAISIIDRESIEQVPVASIDQILQGQAAGLNIQTSSGQPGDSGTIIIRGRTSVQGDIEPLFIIDGIPVNEDNFRSLNANDIESISVLKDASASALYGNRASGGVIVVTTKKGRYNSGNSITYRSLYGVSQELKPGFEVMNSLQYLTFQRDNGLGGNGNLTDAEITELAKIDTDWIDVFFRQGKTNSHEVNITTGNETTRTYNSIGYFEQEGTTRRSDLKRFTLRTNLETKINDKLTFGTNLTVNFSKSNFAEDAGTGQLDNPFITAYLSRPQFSPYNEDGTLNLLGDGSTGFDNLPYIALSSNSLDTNIDEEIKMVGSFKFNYDIFKNVSTGVTVGMDFEEVKGSRLINPLSLRGLNDGTNAPAQGDVKGSDLQQYNRDFAINVTPRITYRNTFNDIHDFEVSLFSEFYKREVDFFRFQAFGINPLLIGSGNGFTSGLTTEGANNDIYPYIPTTTLSSNEVSLFSYFGVIKYDYNKKYGIQMSARRDGASRFHEDVRYGNFWSVSGKWNIHKEKFMENIDYINKLKLRLGYGITGSQNIGGSTLRSPHVGSDSYTQTTGYLGNNALSLAVIGNRNAVWEETNEFNIGLDFGFFKNRLSGSIDVYEKETSDRGLAFFARPVTFLSGITTLDGNVIKIGNKGIELTLDYDIIRTKDFTWNIYGNIANNKNEVLEIPNDDDGIIEDPANVRLAHAIGQPLGTFFAVKWAGVNPANGRPLYLDIDGNITETYSDENRVLLDKGRDPKFIGGFGTKINYKGFALSTLFTYALEQYRNNGAFGVIAGASTGIYGFSNASTDLLNAWQEPGDITNIPALDFNDTRLQLTDRFIEDASFVRLRNVSLSYNFSKKQLEKTKFFNGLRITVQGQNLLTFTKWRGFDPESNISSTFFEFPTPKTYTLGFDLTF